MSTTETPSPANSRHTGTAAGHRKSGSCRFSPYFKLEWFDASLCVWRPLQKAFATLALADAAKDAVCKWRVFEVSESGRRLLQ